MLIAIYSTDCCFLYFVRLSTTRRLAHLCERKQFVVQTCKSLKAVITQSVKIMLCLALLLFNYAEYKDISVELKHVFLSVESSILFKVK